MINFSRTICLVKKELTLTLRDKRMFGMIFVVPIVQLFIFGYIVSTDVNHVSTGILDEDRTLQSREFIDRFIRSGYFDFSGSLRASSEIDKFLENNSSQMILRIPKGFSKEIGRNRTASIQTIFDGADSMTAGIVSGYVQEIVRQYSSDLAEMRLSKLKESISRIPGIEVRVRVWYNPELKSVYFMVPGVICTVLFIATMMMTSMAIVKEKEIGTLEQLIVTPIKPLEFLIGKTLPFFIIGFVEMIMILLVSIFWFRVNVSGSIPLLFALTGLFLFASLGLGIFISTISQTQQEATMSSFLIMLPSMILSGYLFPVENMPEAIQWITYAIPLKYFLIIVRGIFLKGTGLDIIFPQVLALAAISVTIFSLSLYRFHKHLD
ncbi:ABC transporter permease [bacterium]|nr:ABC transporter permease [bacterium]